MKRDVREGGTGGTSLPEDGGWGVNGSRVNQAGEWEGTDWDEGSGSARHSVEGCGFVRWGFFL